MSEGKSQTANLGIKMGVKDKNKNVGIMAHEIL